MPGELDDFAARDAALTTEPKPETAPDDFASRDADISDQRAGARRALITSSMAAAVETPPERASKVAALADKLGMSDDVVAANYDQLSRSVQLRSVDYSRLMLHHPELSSWLSVPSNASLAHDDVPVLQDLDRTLKGDPNGILPYGYIFRKDGTIRGPLHEDGSQPVIYKTLDKLRQKFEREISQEGMEQRIVEAEAERQRATGAWFPSVNAGVAASVLSSVAALQRMTGLRLSDDKNWNQSYGGDDTARQGELISAGSAVNSPGISGVVGSTIGQVIGDAPLYLLGGEVAGVSDLITSMRSVSAAAKALPAVPQSEYLIDAWKTALAYSPIAARSGINTGAENGAGYGVQDFLINSLIPGSFGSKFGVARAVVPGRETVLPSAPWQGLAGRLLTNAGAQGGINAATELANAIHEQTSGIDPDALTAERLVPRLAQAGAMGAVLGSAFQLPAEIGHATAARQIASNAAMAHGDWLGKVVELVQASKLSERSPERFNAMLHKLIPDEARVQHFQRDDWEGIAKDANLSADDLAAQMHVEEQWRLAQVTKQAMTVPTADMVRVAAGLEDPKAISSVLTHVRKIPEGINVKEALEFYTAAPKEIDEQLASLKADVTKSAKATSESDPIYQDFKAKQLDAGETEQAADSNARIMAAFFNTRAERWNAEADGRGAAKIDAMTEYQRYALRVEKELPGSSGIEPLDMMLDKIRAGKISADEIGPISRIAEKGVTPESIERAHAEGLIDKPTPEALRSALDAERDAAPANPERDALLALQTHVTSLGADFAHTNEEIKALMAGRELPAVAKFEQPDKGSLSFNAERHFLVTLTGKADLSTVLHESGHLFLEVMGDFAEREGAPESFRSDYAKALEYLGVSKRSELGKEQHEKWARSIEQYLMEGHAPSAELRPVFQRFALWLVHLYRQFKALVKLTPEVRGVMDRLLASDDAITKAEADLGTSTIFKDRESSGMTEAGWAAYLKDIQRGHEAAQANVFRKAMATLRHENTKAYKRERSAAMADAAAIVNARPVSKAEDALIRGVDAEGKTLTDKPKLSRAEVEAIGPVSTLPRGITAPDGMPLRLAADLFGFANGDDLWTALANLPDRKEATRTLADQILRARHPDLTPDVMLTKAMDAVHANSAHADVLGRESAALAIKAGRSAIPQEQIRQVAERMIDETPYRDIRPSVHLAAEKAASRRATDALLKKEPDYAEALFAKQSEELSHTLYRAAMEAEEVIEKADAIMADAKRTKTQQMLGKAPGQTWMVTDPNGTSMSFLDEATAAEYAKQSGGTLAHGPGYRIAMEQLREFWGSDGRQDLTYGQVHDFYQAAKATLHQAKEAYSLMVEGKRVDLEKAVADGIAVEKANAKGGPKSERPIGAIAKIGVGLGKFDAMMRNLSFVCRQMDGDKSGGWHWEHIDRPLTKAGVDELAMNVADQQWWDAHVKAALGKPDMNRMLHIPGIGMSLSHGQRLMVALNRGSTKNLRRLMDGERWTIDQVKNITDTLTKEDWAYVKGVWDYLKTKRDPIFSLHEKLDGVPPQKRDSIPIETPFGTIQGEYFPIIYDPALSARANEISMERQASPVTGTPRAGFTQATVERTDLRLLLDSRAITRHLSDVSHYLSHAEVIANLNKLLGNRNLSESMVHRFGLESFKVIQDTVQDAARGMRGPQTFAENCLHFLRTRSGAAIMGFNAMSGASQVFGMTQSMERVGFKPYMSALGEILKDAVSVESTSKKVMELSDMMRLRGQSQYLESLEQQSAGTFTSVPGWFREHAYWISNKAQWLVDLPTWVAAHNNALKEFPGQNAKAVALADAAVLDTQGSGFLKDQSKIQRMNELGKLFMQFGSFFNKTYQLGRNRIAADTTLRKVGPVSLPIPDSPAAVARLAGSFLLLVSLPTVAMSAFREAVKPSKDDDGTPEYWAKHLAKDHLGYLLGTMVLGRELSGALNGFDYSGPAGLRTFALTTQLIKQFGQGEADKGLARAGLLTAGSFWGLPAVQLQRIIDGVRYDNERASVNPLPLLFGAPANH